MANAREGFDWADDAAAHDVRGQKFSERGISRSSLAPVRRKHTQANLWKGSNHWQTAIFGGMI